MIPRVDASLISEMKDMAEENRRLKRMYAEMSMQNDLLKEALGKKALRPSHRREPLGALLRNALPADNHAEETLEAGQAGTTGCA